MKKVLFVCLGNICRSPMAEYVFRETVQEPKMYEIASAATSSWEHGNPVHQGTQKVLRNHLQVETTGKTSRPVTKDDFYTYDYIFAMDEQNLSDLQAIQPKDSKAKVVLFLSEEIGLGNQSVPDPYYTGDFEQTYSLVSRGCALWDEYFRGLHN